LTAQRREQRAVHQRRGVSSLGRGTGELSQLHHQRRRQRHGRHVRGDAAADWRHVHPPHGDTQHLAARLDSAQRRSRTTHVSRPTIADASGRVCAAWSMQRLCVYLSVCLSRQSTAATAARAANLLLSAPWARDIDGQLGAPCCRRRHSAANAGRSC